jgi:hypothetical protein
MIRNWITAAASWVQTGTKASLGNAADVQHMSYLVDADLFLTADKRLARVAQAVETLVPDKIATTLRVKTGGAGVVADIGETLQSWLSQ